jgi:transposase-like protein
MTARQSSATDRALALIRQGVIPYRAAKVEGIALSTIYRALKRQGHRAQPPNKDGPLVV